jgi:hypothetical protein
VPILITSKSFGKREEKKMSLTPFDAGLGNRQGRIRPIRFAPTSGEYAFVLGSDRTGDVHDFAVGDFAEVHQDADLSDACFLRCRLRLRNAKRIPSGVNWQASITVDGIERATMRVPAGGVRARADLAAHVSKLSGVHSVGFRLELVAV